MPRCSRADTCIFFTTAIGYSPELNHAMKQRYCLEDHVMCARRAALELLGEGLVPQDMLPSDHELFDSLRRSYA